MSTRTSRPKNDLREEAKEILFGDEPGAPEPAGERPHEVTEREMTEVGEEATGVEYYLFRRHEFYGEGSPVQIASMAVNESPIPSKREVFAFLRALKEETTGVQTFVLVKVVDELEVEAPAADNIVRSNPRQKKPRKGE